MQGYYAVFRAAFLLSLWALLFGVAQFVWRRSGVDYHAVLGIPTDVTYTATLTVVFSSYILVFGCFVVFVLELLAPEMFSYPIRTLPLLALLSPVVLLLWPTDSPPIFFFTSPGSAVARRLLLFEALATVFYYESIPFFFSFY